MKANLPNRKQEEESSVCGNICVDVDAQGGARAVVVVAKFYEAR